MVKTGRRARHRYDFKRDWRNLDGHRMLRVGTGGEHDVPIDLRPLCPPVDDQGEEGSCTANAGVGLAEFDMMRQGVAYQKLSRQFLYWNTRNMEGTASDDSGATITDTVLAWAKFGICPEADDPYLPGNLTARPGAQAYIDAQPEAAQNTSRVEQTLSSIYTCLAAGFPIMLGIQVFESFESEAAAATGRIPAPDTAKEELLGGHAIVIVGIDVAKNIVRFRNSWGTGWGDGGYGTLPLKEYVLNPELASDLWVVRGIGAAADVPPAEGPVRGRRGIVQAGFLEHVGDDSPIWKLADALEAGGDEVIRLEWTDDAGPALRDGPLDYWINYSWGKAQAWHSLAKCAAAGGMPRVANEFTIAGVACFLFGQVHGLVWHEYAAIERAVSFNVSSFPVSDPIRDADAVEVRLANVADGLPPGPRVNVNCDGLGLTHVSISGDTRVQRAIIEAVAGIVPKTWAGRGRETKGR